MRSSTGRRNHVLVRRALHVPETVGLLGALGSENNPLELDDDLESARGVVSRRIRRRWKWTGARLWYFGDVVTFKKTKRPRSNDAKRENLRRYLLPDRAGWPRT